MNDISDYLHVGILGAVNGIIFGTVCETTYRIRFYSLWRELEKAADEGGPIVDLWYPWAWWTLPFICLIIFTVAAIIVYSLRSRRSLSIMRLWQEVGFVSMIVFLFPMLIYYDWIVDSYFVWTVLFLFALVFVLNSLFGGFLQLLLKFSMRRDNFTPEDAS